MTTGGAVLTDSHQNLMLLQMIINYKQTEWLHLTQFGHGQTIYERYINY